MTLLALTSRRTRPPDNGGTTTQECDPGAIAATPLAVRGDAEAILLRGYWRVVVVPAGEEPTVAALGGAGESAVQAVAARLIQVEMVPIVATTPRLSARIIGDRQCPKDATLRSISTFWIVRMSLTSLENLR